VKNKQHEVNNIDIATTKDQPHDTTATANSTIKEDIEKGKNAIDNPISKKEDTFYYQQQTKYNLHDDYNFSPRILVIGVGGAGGNAINNMIHNQQKNKTLTGVDFLTINTDVQHLRSTLTENQLQIGKGITSGLGCGANPDAGRAAAEESKDEILERISDAHMVFLTAISFIFLHAIHEMRHVVLNNKAFSTLAAILLNIIFYLFVLKGMGGGTGTGATPIISELCYENEILTVAVVTKPFRFEGTHRMRLANEGISRLKNIADTLIVIPNQNLFTVSNENTSFIDAFQLADDVLLAGVKSITDLMTTPGLINLDFADVQSVMSGMGNAMLGTGQSSSTENRAIEAAEQAIYNPLLNSNEDKMDISTAKGMLVNISGGKDMTLFEVDKAAARVTEILKDPNVNIIFGSSYDESLEGSISVSVVATGIDENEEFSSI